LFGVMGCIRVEMLLQLLAEGDGQLFLLGDEYT
jgi:hypothetical protein